MGARAGGGGGMTALNCDGRTPREDGTKSSKAFGSRTFRPPRVDIPGGLASGGGPKSCGDGEGACAKC